MCRILIFCVFSLQCFAEPFDFYVEVVDEQNLPQPLVEVTCDSLPLAATDIWNAPGRRQRLYVKTDVQGRARLAGRHVLSELVISVSADTFYTSAKRVFCSQKNIKFILVKRLSRASCQRFELRTVTLPQDGQAHGFDLRMGAFTAPLGVGLHPDVFIKGKCPPISSASLGLSSLNQDLGLRFAGSGAGALQTPRPSQRNFGASIAAGCDGQSFPGLSWPRRAPLVGYGLEVQVETPSSGKKSSGSGEGVPQWIFCIQRTTGCYYGVITDLSWTAEGRLYFVYHISQEADNLSLEFYP